VGSIASALFFVLALVAAASILLLTVRDHWAEMRAALRGEMPVRRSSRPWVRSVRTQVRPRPTPVRARQPQRAAV
jgi:hypothetical protein